MLRSEVSVQDHSAQYYETRYKGYGGTYHFELVTELMASASGKILDAGCGTGFVSKCYPWLDITGIDVSEGMLARHPGHWLQMDVCGMSFADASFDFIVCRSLLHHLPNHRMALAEMHRVLKPKGRIVFLETNKSAIATMVRRWSQHGDRFSEYHHSFKDRELLADISHHFIIDETRYLGFLAYPLFGFPDLIDFTRWMPGKVTKDVLYHTCQIIDGILEHTPCLKRLSWAISIAAHKS